MISVKGKNFVISISVSFNGRLMTEFYSFHPDKKLKQLKILYGFEERCPLNIKWILPTMFQGSQLGLCFPLKHRT